MGAFGPAPSRRIASARSAALALLLASGAAHAALFDDDEARKRIADTNVRLAQVQAQLETRIAALEQQLKAQGLVEMLATVEQIKADLARLRGQVEVVSFELAEAQKRQRDLYVDLDTRMRKLEAAPAASPAAPAAPASAAPGAPAMANVPASPASGTPPVAGTSPPAVGLTVPVPGSPAADAANAAAEQREYDAALELFKRADYPGAITAFSTFVKAHPKSALAPSAQYWVGNAQFARRDFRAAIGAQRQLLAQYPDSAKVPDAMLNVASAQGELNDNAAARRTLEDLIARYPTSEAAGKARQRLGVR
jgi:tol-pal system protein YbgF